MLRFIISFSGAVYKNDCKAQDKIPIFLIVGGSIGLVRNVLCVKKTKDDDNEDDDKKAVRKTPCRARKIRSPTHHL